MSQMIIAGPFEEFELTDEHWLQPLAFGHLRLRESLAPSTTLRLRQVHERALVDLKSSELLEQLCSSGGCEAVASACDVDQAVAFVVAEDQRVEGPRPPRVAADDALLTALDAHL